MTGRTVSLIAAALALALPSAASAELSAGARAPNFVAKGARGGKLFTVNLASALKRGPVVLYFYPKAFTSGCTMEAHAFAEATADFRKAGATVIGMSNDDVATLQRFSTEECRDKFAVATATSDVIKSYDVTLPVAATRSNRTSYVIAPNGKIVFAYTAMSPEGHVSGTLDAVKKWKAAK